jgi:hypothetical protein
VFSVRQNGQLGREIDWKLQGVFLSRSAPTLRSHELPSVIDERTVIIGRMSFADWLAGRKPHTDRLPARIEELRGPAQGVVSLPRHLALPGVRECDVTDAATRRSMAHCELARLRRHRE